MYELQLSPPLGRDTPLKYYFMILSISSILLFDHRSSLSDFSRSDPLHFSDTRFARRTFAEHRDEDDAFLLQRVRLAVRGVETEGEQPL